MKIKRHNFYFKTSATFSAGLVENLMDPYTDSSFTLFYLLFPLHYFSSLIFYYIMFV